MASWAPAAYAELKRGPCESQVAAPSGAADEILKRMLIDVIGTSISNDGEAIAAPPSNASSELANAEIANAEIAAMSDAAVLACFESLGDNCELGIVQRACGVQALGLLSFARTPPDMLAEIFESRLDGVGDPDALRLATREVEGGIEHIVFNDRLGIVYHIADHHAVVKDPGELLRSESARLAALAQDMLAKLASGSRIFVVKCNEDLTRDEAARILDEMTRHGPNALLYVVTADHAHEEGCVVALAPNLYRGHIGGFAPYNDAYSGSAAAWTAICRNALRLRRAERLAAGAR